MNYNHSCWIDNDTAWEYLPCVYQKMSEMCNYHLFLPASPWLLKKTEQQHNPVFYIKSTER